MDRRRERRYKPGPVVVSLLLHGVAVGALALAGPAEPPKGPQTKVYAVDIVSPPPNVPGPPMTEARANQEPGPAAEPAPPAAAPAETPPAPEPEPPAPDPEPAPPPREAPREAPKEPQKAPEPRRTPPAQPAPRPSTPAQRPSSTTNRPTTTPEKSRPPATPEKNRPTTNRPSTGSSTTSGTGSGTNRTRGDGTSTAPATGPNAQPGAAGGEGINIHVEGEPCPVAGYCERVTLQVQRYFRPPPDNAGARGEVCFRIQRDGSVTDIQTRGVRGGGAGFRLAMMEAAEAAGSRRAFGTLPGAFDPQRWRWCVELSPR